MKKLIYFADPMCSWCYGFAPVISLISEKFQDRLEMSLVTGGLYTGGTTFQDAGRINFLRNTWTRIQELTGQTFNFDILNKEGWLYDTEMSCRAVVAVRRLRSDLVFPCFSEVQRNFYVRGLDSQASETFVSAAVSCGIDAGEFLEEFQSEGCAEETRGDFDLARKAGVSGYPTILLADNNRIVLLTSGYQPYEAIEPAIQGWLAG